MYSWICRSFTINRKKYFHKKFKQTIYTECFSGTKGAFNAKILDISENSLKFTPNSNKYKFVLGDYVRIEFLLNENPIDLLVQITNEGISNSYDCIFLKEYSSEDSIKNVTSFLRTQIP